MGLLGILLALYVLAPVIANGKLYIMGYLGEGPDLQEGIACFDADSGKMLSN